MERKPKGKEHTILYKSEYWNTKAKSKVILSSLLFYWKWKERKGREDKVPTRYISDTYRIYKDFTLYT